MSRNVDVIIPTLNHSTDLIACLSSLNESVVDKQGAAINVVVVDDHSSKSEREEIITNLCKFNIFKQLNVEVIFMGKQSGVMKCCNEGLKISLGRRKKPEFICFMHDDTAVFTKDWILTMIGELDADATAMGVEAFSLSEYDLHNVKSLKIDGIPDNATINEENISFYYDKFYKDLEAIEVDEAQLYATMFRTEAFERYGMFIDECVAQIDMELEFCKRIIDSGKFIKASQKACVLHKSRMLSPYENSDQETLRRMRAASAWNRKVIAETSAMKKKSLLYTFLKDDEQVPNIDADQSMDFIFFEASANKVASHPWNGYDASPLAEFLGVDPNGREMKEYIRMHPHYFFKKHTMSMFIDHLLPIVAPSDFIKHFTPDDILLTLDDESECAYEKLLAIKSKYFIDEDKFNGALSLLKWCSYPKENGMINPSLLVRRHNDVRCIDAMNKAYGFMKKTLMFPEIFINFSLWLLKLNYKCLPSKLAKRNDAKGHVT